VADWAATAVDLEVDLEVDVVQWAEVLVHMVVDSEDWVVSVLVPYVVYPSVLV
jgi:predicted protein tyrosine phosphatase